MAELGQRARLCLTVRDFAWLTVLGRDLFEFCQSLEAGLPRAARSNNPAAVRVSSLTNREGKPGTAAHEPRPQLPQLTKPEIPKQAAQTGRANAPNGAVGCGSVLPTDAG